MNFFGKSKAQDELSTSDKDPMNSEVLCDEIRELILSYLPINDLLNATLVSRLWNQTIGESFTFKKRVAIKIHSWNDEPPSAIAKSSRSYEILSISDFKRNAKTLEMLAGKNWRQLTLSIGRISSQKRFLETMGPFTNVRELKILSTNIRELNSNVKLTLPELEIFSLSDVTLDLFDIFIARQPSLKTLSLRFVSCDILSPRRAGEALVEFLKLNDYIQDLELNYEVVNDLFLVNVSTMLNLKLRGLTIGLDETADTVRPNIELFLKSQGDSTENLKLIFHQKSSRTEHGNWWHHNDRNEEQADDIMILFNSWNSMTAMKFLNLRFLKNSADIEISPSGAFLKTLKRNTNVTSIALQHMEVSIPQSIIIAILKLSPNLHSLYVTKLTPAVVRFAALNLKALKELMCFSFEGESQQEYVELKTSRNDVNKFIAITDRCALG